MNAAVAASLLRLFRDLFDTQQYQCRREQIEPSLIIHNLGYSSGGFDDSAASVPHSTTKIY